MTNPDSNIIQLRGLKTLWHLLPVVPAISVAILGITLVLPRIGAKLDIHLANHNRGLHFVRTALLQL